MSAPAILVVEDDAALREALEETLSDAGFPVRTAEDGARALLVMEQHPVELVISDVQMSPVDGLELLATLRASRSEVPVVLMTAYGSIEQAVEAIQGGAANYLAKPFAVDELLEMVERYLPRADRGGLVAEDPRSRDVLDLARRLADNDLTVMISGESGTGKEVFARYIHAHSARRDAPFVAINCAAIPENMLEAMLFGYEKGAFTGAEKSHPGKFEQAQHGTLLLDEISEMGQPLQAKLLRVLQEREVERLGGRSSIELDVRVLATSNRDLKAEVREGRFREDLYYRLNVLPLALPPLRERPGDILALAEQTIAASHRASSPPPRLTDAARQRLVGYTWPGNVRELTNLIQRAMVLAAGDDLDVAHLSFEFEPHRVVSVELPEVVSAPAGTDQMVSLEEDLRAREREIIFAALRHDGGNREAAATRLGISPRTLRHKLARMREEGAAIPGEASSRA